MMTKLLIAYASMAGSTAEIAGAIAEALPGGTCEVEVKPIDEVSAIDGYDGVVVGGPMIMGWHRAARGFLRRHRDKWARIPVAVYFTAMKLTKLDEKLPAGIPFTLDAGIMQQPSNPGRLSPRERYSLPSNYLRPILRGLQPAVPASVAIFGGRLVFGRLPWWAVPVALLAAGGQAGDKRDWALIRSWAAGLPAAMDLSLK